MGVMRVGWMGSHFGKEENMERVLPSAILAGVCCLCASANAGLIASYQCYDHPDGNENPPPYGLRFDNLFSSIGGTGGVTTFSMNTFGDTVLSVYDDGGGDYRITIAGTVFGGVDTGTGYGFGEGAYALDFEYRANVGPDGTGWVVSPSDPMNTGTLTSLGNPDVANGTIFSMFDVNNGDNDSFLFLQDEHRLAGHPQEGQGYWVGRGWLDSSHHSGGTKDFLFIAIPTPGAASMGLMGVGLAASRRRR